MLFRLAFCYGNFFLCGQMACKHCRLYYLYVTHPVVLLHINQYHVSRT
jgi:hypothetical protein